MLLLIPYIRSGSAVAPGVELGRNAECAPKWETKRADSRVVSGDFSCGSISIRSLLGNQVSLIYMILRSRLKPDIW